MEQELSSESLPYDMVVEGEDKIAVRRVYPANASVDEILKGVSRTPQVTLQCFDPLLVDELYSIGKEISCRNHQLYDAAMKGKALWDTLKCLFAMR